MAACKGCGSEIRWMDTFPGEILKPGDMVEPRTEQVHIDRRLGLNIPVKSKVAYATKDLDEAKRYSARANQEQGTLFSPVYEVEAVEGDKPEESTSKSWYNEQGEHPLNYHLTSPEVTHVKSTKGFKVKKQVGWA